MLALRASHYGEDVRRCSHTIHEPIRMQLYDAHLMVNYG